MNYLVCVGGIVCAMAFCAVGLSVSETRDHEGYALQIASQDARQ